MSLSLSLSRSLARSLPQAKREIEARLVPLQQSVGDFEEELARMQVLSVSLFLCLVCLNLGWHAPRVQWGWNEALEAPVRP